MFLVEKRYVMKNASKLSFDQRCKIEEMINLRKRKFEIADEIGKTRSTVAREIKRHRKLKPSNLFNENAFNCKYFKDCKVCTGKCNLYQSIKCPDRDRYIGACNNCHKLKSCKLDKYFYKANVAQKGYEYTLTDARQGVNLTRSELIELAHIICPLIKKRPIYLYYLTQSSQNKIMRKNYL